MSLLVQAADKFAAEKHTQQRKYTNEPYIVHPRAVRDLVATVPHDDAMLAAALLHDVEEDCGVTNAEIRLRFGDDVADLVSQLTDVAYADMPGAHVWEFQSLAPHNGEYWHKCARCQQKDWIASYGNESQLLAGKACKPLNRAERAALNRAHTATASPRAKTVKLADLLDNTRSITTHDPDFAVVYMREKELLLPLLIQGDPLLFKRAADTIMQYYLSRKHREVR